MRRGRKKSAEEIVASETFEKSTYLLDPVLKENLRYISLAEKVEMSELVREALRTLVRSKGLDPATPPSYVFGA